eukprot:2330908-Prymnesium_polylepis.1
MFDDVDNKEECAAAVVARTADAVPRVVPNAKATPLDISFGPEGAPSTPSATLPATAPTGTSGRT